MTGLPKRTSLKSSPEDAAYYRRFHDSALSALRKGTPRDELLKELIGQGTPEKTAERIVLAVEREADVKTALTRISPGKFWGSIAFSTLVAGATSAFLVWKMGEDRTLSLRYLLPGLIVVVAMVAIVIGRLLLRIKGPLDLPPPR